VKFSKEFAATQRGIEMCAL